MIHLWMKPFRSVSDMPGATTSTPRKKRESFLKTAAKIAFPKKYNTRAHRMETGVPVEEIKGYENLKLKKTKKK